MCGIAGLFGGCAAFLTCPVAALWGTTGDDGPAANGRVGAGVVGGIGEQEYCSPLLTWHTQASVRQSPRRVLEVDDSRYRLFSPEMVPLARHPLVRALPPATFQEVLTQHLYRYLDFTTKLEHLVVNRTVLSIAHGEVGFPVPDDMAFDAYKIYCDEAYHALAAADLLRQARAQSHVEPLLEPLPYFIQRLRVIQDGVGQGLEPLVELLFVVCAETLISASLAEIPDDPSVAIAVRETIRDHAHDEGRHHRYFAAFLRVLWPSLTSSVRRSMGILLPDLIDAFLRPDRRVLQAELAGYGFGRDDTEQILAEVFADDVMRASAASTAFHTVHHLASVGALDDPATRDRFALKGLLPSELA
jgi:hypothetical protein